jgi:hypothetical protein
LCKYLSDGSSEQDGKAWLDMLVRRMPQWRFGRLAVLYRPARLPRRIGYGEPRRAELFPTVTLKPVTTCEYALVVAIPKSCLRTAVDKFAI